MHHTEKPNQRLILGLTVRSRFIVEKKMYYCNKKFSPFNTSGWPPGKTKCRGNSPTLLLRCNTSILLSFVSTTAPFPSGLEVC